MGEDRKTRKKKTALLLKSVSVSKGSLLRFVLCYGVLKSHNARTSKNRVKVKVKENKVMIR